MKTRRLPKPPPPPPPTPDQRLGALKADLEMATAAQDSMRRLYQAAERAIRQEAEIEHLRKQVAQLTDEHRRLIDRVNALMDLADVPPTRAQVKAREMKAHAEMWRRRAELVRRGAEKKGIVIEEPYGYWRVR